MMGTQREGIGVRYMSAGEAMRQQLRVLIWQQVSKKNEKLRERRPLPWQPEGLTQHHRRQRSAAFRDVVFERLRNAFKPQVCPTGIAITNNSGNMF